MNRTPIKDFYGRVCGWIEENTATGDKVGKDFYNRIVGFYIKKENVTKDFYRRIVAKGDILTSLIMEAERNNSRKK